MAHRYGDPCETCGQPAYDYNVPLCDACRRERERNGTDRLSQLYTPGKAALLAEIRAACEEPTDAQTPIVLDIQGTGREPVAYRARFAAEDQALAHMDAHPELYFTEVEAEPLPDSCARLLARLYPLCEHNMSLELCMGPAHYATDEEIRQGW